MDNLLNFSNSSTIDSKICYLNFGNGKSSNKANNLVRIDEYVKGNLPQIPCYASRPEFVKKAAKFFLEHFQGTILYSVKSNPDIKTLQYLFDSGIKNFDVASLNEVKLIDGLFGKKIKMFFMHPIKNRQAISEAYFNYDIRDFSLDSSDAE